MRSGTTLVFNILGKHHDIFTRKGEPKVIEYLSIARRYYPDLTDDDTLQNFIGFCANVIRFGRSLERFGQPLIETDDFKDKDVRIIIRELQRRDYYSIFHGVYDYFAQSAGKTMWCAKMQTLEATTFITQFPDSKFIEIVRDPRDVLASKKKDRDAVWHSERYKPEQRAEKDLYNTYNSLWDSLSWRAEMRAGRDLRKKHSGLFLLIRYEDLVSEPATYVKRICDFLNVSYDETMLNINERNSSVWDKKYKGIGAESVGKWRTQLAPAEVALSQWITRSEMRMLGYDIVPVNFLDKLKIPGLLAVSLAEFMQRLVKRYRLGGWPYLMNVLRMYWKKLKAR